MRREGRRRGSVKEIQETLTQNMAGRVERGEVTSVTPRHGLTRGRQGTGGEKSVIRFEKFLKTFHLNIKWPGLQCCDGD